MAAAIATAIVSSLPSASWSLALDNSLLRQSSNAATASGSVGIRLVDIPVDSAKDPRAHVYIVDQLAPGTTIQRRIEISNGTSEALPVRVYSAGATIIDGSFIGSVGRTLNDLSSWTTLESPDVSVPAKSVVTDLVTVAVPQDAAPGEQYAAIWAEVGAPGDGGVALVNRVGIRMYVSVSGDNAAPSNFTVDSLTAERDANGQAVVQAQVHNTGGRALDMSGTLALVSASGALNAGPYPAVLGTTLAPGQSEPVQVTLTDAVEAGPWNATIELTSGLITESFSAQVTFPAGTGVATPSPATAVGGPDIGTIVLIAVGSTLLVTALALVLILLIVRRKHRTGAPGVH